MDDAICETDFPVAKDEEVWCTPRGEVMLIDGARSVYDLNAEEEERLAEKRQHFWQGTERAKALEEVRRISGIRELADLPKPKATKVGELVRDGYRIEKVVLHLEPGLDLPALVFVPGKRVGAACLYLHAEGKQADAASGGPIERLVREGRLVMAPDLAGIGETTPTGKHSYRSYLPPDWQEATIAYLLGTSLLAMRAEEILTCARYLAEAEPATGLRSVELISVGRTGPPALHAAALEPDLFGAIRLRNSLVSWSNVVHTPQSRNQFVNLVHGALRVYDLPDLARTLPSERLVVVEPLNGAEEPAE